MLFTVTEVFGRPLVGWLLLTKEVSRGAKCKMLDREWFRLDTQETGSYHAEPGEPYCYNTFPKKGPSQYLC
uniref:Putative secreted protein n=1 Tax=Anopheles darlingi TaxID=43151 RepID=A0A2M4DIV7_ANODA